MIISRSVHHFSPDNVLLPEDQDTINIDLESLSRSLKKALAHSDGGFEYTSTEFSANRPGPLSMVTVFPALEHEYLIYLSDNTLGHSGSEDLPVERLKSLLGSARGIVALGSAALSLKAPASRIANIQYVLAASQESTPLLILPDSFDPLDLSGNEWQSLSPIAATLRLQDAGRARVDANLSIKSCASHDAEPGLVVLQLKVTLSLLAPAIFAPLHTTTALVSRSQVRLLSLVFPKSEHNAQRTEHVLTSAEFYSALKPAPPLSDDKAAIMQPAGLVPALLPFQRRSVAWLLQCEGHNIGLDTPNTNQLPLFWETVKALDTSPASEAQQGDSSMWYYSPSLGELRAEAPNDSPFLGGMLCEEMGLGKTVECIAMILHHRALALAPLDTPAWWDNNMGVKVTPVHATLIVTPPQLLLQWIDELAHHAPTLRVHHYQGWKYQGQLAHPEEGNDASTTGQKRKRSTEINSQPAPSNVQAEEEAWTRLVRSNDVVVTTYMVLQNDLHFARPPVRRPRRGGRPEPVRKRSSLITIEWARVIMDEVQLVGNANAQEMVSMIPRRASFAVSGTPVNMTNTVRDLDKTLKFIGAWYSQQHWTRLLQPSFRPELEALLDRIVIRTTKAAVTNELSIPPQQYFVVPIKPGPVEQHFYETQMEAAMADLGVRGHPTPEQFDTMEVVVLRNWFRKLRMACIHPQIGHLQMNGGIVGGAFKSIEDVLNDMKHQSWSVTTLIQRNLCHTQLRLSLLLHKLGTPKGQEERLAVLESVHAESILLENIISDAIRRQDKLGIATELTNSNTVSAQDLQEGSSKGKGKQKEITPAPDSGDDQGDLLTTALTDVAPDTRAGRTHWQHLVARRVGMLHRLREVVEMQHRVAFFLGDYYHQAGDGSEENRWYDEAEKLRKRLLKEHESRVQRYIETLSGFLERPAGKSRQLERCGQGGIMSDDILNEANEAMPYLEKLQDLLSQLRANIIQHLTSPLNAESDSQAGADGNEYDRSLDSQAKIETFLQAYQLTLADRLKGLNGQQSLVENQRVGRNRTGGLLEEGDDGAEPSGLAPEKELENELRRERSKCAFPVGMKPLKLGVRDLVGVRGRSNNEEETAIATIEEKRLKKVVSEEEKAMATLQAEMVTFRQTFNARIVYYKQLQTLSDSVVDVEWTTDELPMLLARCRGQISDEEEELKRAQSKNKYLEFMSKKMSNEAVSKEDRCCQICQIDFESGFITNCGHVFCRECMNMWLKRRHRSCPACRSVLNNNTLHRVDFGPTTSSAEDEQTVDGGPVLKTNIQYHAYDPRQFGEFECQGQYGEKIQTLVRHLRWIEEQEPGSQSVVFSAWADSLSVIEHALKRNGISCIRADGPRTKSDPVQDFRDQGIQVLFLHGERDNAGMNITCASNVFLVEPVVSHTFELQAIARVDRLGQTRATKVFCYYCVETIEKNILDLAVLQGKSLYSTRGSTTNSLSSVEEMGVRQKKAPGMRGDYVVKKSDLLFCMFPTSVRPHVAGDDLVAEYLPMPAIETSRSIALMT